ncbi:FtsX-like permease family protein [Micromonospora avicenniae]|uniref:FtsX-like permease family protein n=1 Tax=Micromonospora avicenniae TaxID=1198245 RepID=UPI0033317512
MKLVWRRAREARGLLAAALIAALVAVALVTGLSEYNRRAVDAGQRALVAAASAEERSLLVSGSGGADADEFATRDRKVRDEFAHGLGDAQVSVTAARYGTGRELTGDLGPAVRPGGEPVFANLSTLENLAGHADLVAGVWPVPGARPTQVTLPEKVAAALGLEPGERVPLRDRRTERNEAVVLVGTWRPHDPGDPYWRLAPGVGAGAASDDAAATSGTSYGPFVLDPKDFEATFPGSVSASWMVEPDLTTVEPSRVSTVRQASADVAADLPAAADLGASAQTVTRIDQLLDRISRADLVGRSALTTPLLLIVVLGGYALVLVAALLHEDRRAQNALLRARGAARRQLAGLAAREATLVVAPAALLGPLAAGEALRHLRPIGSGASVASGTSGLLWAAAAVAAVGCLVAMVAPTLRGAGTYVADMAARSRPKRSAAVQRASVDLVLVALAVLAWVQLHQYASPLAGAGGQLGVDPLLVAAPTLGVLAGAVVALRLLPPATRFAERFVDRRPWTATMFGMWQAGRRPHAGPVLLLALAVGGSTLAWSLVATGERSQVDQADHTVGADLRLTERNGVAPADRAGQLAALPGVDQALPAWRDEVRIGRANLPVTVLSLDTAAAAGTVRFNDRLADEPVPRLYQRMVDARGAAAGLDLPAGTKKIAGVVSTPVDRAERPLTVAVSMLVTSANGNAWRLPAATGTSDGHAVRFDVELPDVGVPLRLAGFEADGGDTAGTIYRLRISDLRLVGADGSAEPTSLTDTWVLRVPESDLPQRVDATGTTVAADRSAITLPGGQFAFQPASRFAVVPDGENTPVPALMTPRVRDELSLQIGDTVDLPLSGATLPVKLVDVVDTIPGTAGDGVLLDLPAAVDWLIRDSGTVRPTVEWWVGSAAGEEAATARAAAGLAGVTVLDRRQVAEAAERDPYWRGAHVGLLAAALGSVLLALVGLLVDVWATARRRLSEYTVLNTLGATPRLLARALLAEQTFLAGIGVGVGLLLGAAVGATMAPLVILTPAAGRPVPEAVFTLPWLPIGLTAVGLLLAALAASTFIAVGIRQRVSAAQLRIGGER